MKKIEPKMDWVRRLWSDIKPKSLGIMIENCNDFLWTVR